MAKDTEHFFICSLAISVSFLKKCLFKCLILKSGFLIMFWCNLKIGEQELNSGARAPFCMSGKQQQGWADQSGVLSGQALSREAQCHTLRGKEVTGESPCSQSLLSAADRVLVGALYLDWPPGPPITPLHRWRHGGPQRWRASLRTETRQAWLKLTSPTKPRQLGSGVAVLKRPGSGHTSKGLLSLLLSRVPCAHMAVQAVTWAVVRDTWNPGSRLLLCPRRYWPSWSGEWGVAGGSGQAAAGVGSNKHAVSSVWLA